MEKNKGLVLTHLSEATVNERVERYLNDHAPGLTSLRLVDATHVEDDVVIITNNAEESEAYWKQHHEAEALPLMIVLEGTDDLERKLTAHLFQWYEANMAEREEICRRYEVFLDHIRRELASFYHNINNPLTILSGNLQLLQLIAASMNVSEELTNPIKDIADISARFEGDLGQIVTLREELRAFLAQ